MSTGTEPDISDREFEDYLAGNSPLSRHYRETTPEMPSPEIDAAILGQAAEVARKPAIRLPGWLAGPVSGPSPRAALGLVAVCAMALLAVHLAPVDAPQPGAPAGDAVPATAGGTTSGEVATSKPAAPAAGKPGVTSDPPANPAQAAPPAPPAPVPVPAAANTAPAVTAPALGNEPEPWLAEIERLLTDGRQDEARVLFYAMRERFPTYPVPEDLLSRLGM